MTESPGPSTKRTRVDGPEIAPGRRGLPGGPGRMLGLGLVGLWLGLFAASVYQDRLAFGGSTWVPSLPSLGVDFKLAIDHVARVEALGFNPYLMLGDKQCRTYPYPPMLTRWFRWVTWTDKMTASVAWQGALTLFAGLGSIAAWRIRARLGLDRVAWPLILAGVLFSTPFVFAVERGQCDPMIVPMMLVAAWLLGRRGSWPLILAGALLGLTAWIKYYPGLAVVALLTPGRRKALAGFVAVVAAIGLVDRVDLLRSIENGRGLRDQMLDVARGVHPTSHSLAEGWKVSGWVRGSAVLSRIPASVPAAVLIVPALVLVGRRVAGAKDPGALAFPHLLWLACAGTFALPYSNDYNLATLPIALLATWDRRDRAAVQGALAVGLLWLQPVWLPIPGGWLIFAKLGGLYAVGACLGARASAGGGRPLPIMQGRPAFVSLRRVRTSG